MVNALRRSLALWLLAATTCFAQQTGPGGVPGSGGSGGSGVSSFNTRTGPVSPASGDYSVGQVTGAAPLASPALTGTPTAPTQAISTNNTDLATTSAVTTALSSYATAASLSSYAPLASPALTGTPTAPTAAITTNNTDIATTAAVTTALAGYAPATTYTGLLATRGDLDNTYSAAITWGMDRSMHIARQTIPANSLKVVWANYYVTSGNVETVKPGTGTYKASIEYPSGTITACTFSGVSTISSTTISPDIITDACGPAIPNGATFWVRMLYTNTTGISYGTGKYATQDGFIYGTGTPTDDTGGGTVTPNSTASMHPVAIIGTTTYPAICLVGDSRVLSLGDASNDLSGDTGELARSVGPALAYTKLAIGGTTAQAATTNFTNRLRIIAYCSHAIDEFGVNDLAASRTPSQIAANRTTLAGLFGIPTYGTTIPPETTSTDTWTTTTNQTVTVNPAAFNALVIAGISGEVNYFDIDNVIDPFAINKWPVSKIIGATSGTSGFATTDGVHETTAMSLLIKQSGVINPSYFTRR